MNFFKEHNTALITFFLCLLFIQPVIPYVLLNSDVSPFVIIVAVIASLPLCYALQLIPNRWVFSVIILAIGVLCGTDMFLVQSERFFALCGNIVAALTSPPAESQNYTAHKDIYLFWTIPQVIWMIIADVLRFIQVPKYKKIMQYTAASLLAAVLINLIFPVRNLPPYNMLNEGSEAFYQLYQKHKLIPESKDLTFHATRADIKGREIYVLGIGESECSDHWSLNGYNRETTPQLATFKNLISFDDYCSTATLTLYSVPVMLTRATVDDFNRSYFEKSIIEPYKECGFKVFVISTDNLLIYEKHLTRGADKVFNINNDSIAPHLVDSLSQLYPKTLFLVQFYQSHMYYENFTSRYNRWRPNHVSDPGVKSPDIFINGYDNAILNSDAIMADVIRVLDQPDVRSAYLYASDHGEELRRNVITRGMGLHPDPSEYHPAMFFWYNDKWGETHSQGVREIRSLQHKPVNAENYFYTACDMADIKLGKQYAKPEWSMLSSHFKFHKRRVRLPNGITIIDAKPLRK